MNGAVVIGVGNRYRRDDGVGLAVIEHLRAQLPAGARALALEHVPPDLYERWEGAERVFLIDAAASGAAPGTIRRFDSVEEALPAANLRLSTHGFGLGEAIELARALGHLPAEMTVYAVEGGAFEDGEGLSESVSQAAGELAERIREELEVTRA